MSTAPAPAPAPRGGSPERIPTEGTDRPRTNFRGSSSPARSSHSGQGRPGKATRDIRRTLRRPMGPSSGAAKKTADYYPDAPAGNGDKP